MLLEEVKYHLPPRVGLTCQKVVHLKVAQVNILAENLRPQFFCDEILWPIISNSSSVNCVLISNIKISLQN